MVYQNKTFQTQYFEEYFNIFISKIKVPLLFNNLAKF